MTSSHHPMPSDRSHTLRFWVVALLLLSALLGLFIRVVYLAVWSGPFLREQGDARTLRVIDTHAHRGMITDRNGKPLAVSSPVTSIWVDPSQFNASPALLATLADSLSMDSQTLRERISRARTGAREFMYLKRQIAPRVAQHIEQLNIPGVYSRQEYRRFYPEGSASAHLLGFTNIDDHGQEGLELAFDEWLRGIDGKKQVIKDRMGRVISQVKTLQPPRAGRNMQLSIDRRIQYATFNALRKTVQHYHAKAGSVVVLDARTGEVLAMVNYPSYNPNVRQRYSNETTRNRALTDTFEPASLLKPFSIANALVSQQYTTDTRVDTHPGWLRLNGKVIHDIRNYGELSVSDVLIRSSNIGVAKITLSLPPEKLPQLLHEAGFGQTTQSGFPGEVAGKLVGSGVQSPLALATLSYGYGLSVTTMQIASAYSLFANNGLHRPISLFHQPTPPAGKQVLPPVVAQQILQLLDKVATPHGTARRARIKGYTVAGKTGTSRIVGDKGYDRNRHNAFFAGIAPVSAPRLVVAVLIHDPEGKQYYGGQVAAPLFARVTEDALRILNVPPDKHEAA